MNVTILPEPELEFGNGGRHIDIRFGLANYGPLDGARRVQRGPLTLGVVGTPACIADLTHWLERCRNGIPARQSKQPTLFPSFPGCGPEGAIPTPLLLSPRLTRPIPEREFTRLTASSDVGAVVRETVDLFMGELAYLAENTQAEVLMCALPPLLLDYLAGETTSAEGDADNEAGSDTSEDGGAGGMPDLHDLLKARAMRLRLPTQLIRPDTYGHGGGRASKGGRGRAIRLQDEATRAWNLHMALYYKAGGVPWRLVRDPAALSTCYVGIRFYRTTDGSALRTAMAQVFNERGEGVVVRGGAARMSSDDRQPHLDEAGAHRLLLLALDQYRSMHHTMPARVVLHKSSLYSPGERSGFENALGERAIHTFDLITIGPSSARLFRGGSYPPLRGTLLTLDAASQVLYTQGSVEFYATYPGMYVPQPLLIRSAHAEQAPREIAREVLELSKMNWNRTQFDGGDPITLWAAGKVGRVLRYLEDGERVEPHYRYYM